MFDILQMKTMSKNLNNYTYTHYYYELTLLALSLFEWEGLPNNINEKWIEKYLFSNGECMFFKDPDLGLMVSKTTKQGLNVYNEPIELYPVASNYHNVKGYKVGKECVLIRNNDLSIPTEFKVNLYAYRLAEITRTQDININAQKTPILIKCSDKQKLTLKNVYNQYQGNEPVIFGDKTADWKELEVLKTDAPIIFDKLQLQKHQVMNEFLTMIGVNNANQDKKERLVDDEVQANNESVETFFNSMLKAREWACKEINRIFGTNISIKKRIQPRAISEDSEEVVKDSEVSEKGGSLT